MLLECFSLQQNEIEETKRIRLWTLDIGLWTLISNSDNAQEVNDRNR